MSFATPVRLNVTQETTGDDAKTSLGGNGWRGTCGAENELARNSTASIVAGYSADWANAWWVATESQSITGWSTWWPIWGWGGDGCITVEPISGTWSIPEF